MSAPTRSDSELTKRDQMAVSSGALMDVNWPVAGGAAVVVGGADLLMHMLGGHLVLGSPLSAAVMTLFAVAGASVMLRKRGSRALAWARRNPWSFAALPGIATAVLVFVLATVVGSSGFFGGAFTALWHGAIAYGVTGAAGVVSGSRKRGAAS